MTLLLSICAQPGCLLRGFKARLRAVTLRAGQAQVKKAIEKGNIDGAKIYAQNAIRKKTEALNYLRLASRLDAVVSRLDTQAKMNAINSSMSRYLIRLSYLSVLAVFFLNAQTSSKLISIRQRES